MNDEIKAQLRELSFQMMINESAKLMTENHHAFNMRHRSEFPMAFINEQQYFESDLLREDKKGFELSLAYNELLFKNGETHGATSNGPDAVNIWAENYLNKFNLSYPISWYVEYEDREGLHFGYNKSAKIDQDHEDFLRQVEQKDLTDFEKKRIAGIADYYKAHHKLLSRYKNFENLENENVVEEEKGRSM